MSQRIDSYTQTLSVYCRTAQQASTSDEPPSSEPDTSVDTERLQQMKQRADEQLLAAFQETSFATLLDAQMAAVEDT